MLRHNISRWQSWYISWNFLLDQENTDDVPLALFLYEFDAKAHLDYDDVECLVDKISKLPNVDGKTFETIAGVIYTAWHIGFQTWNNLPVKSKN